MALEGPSAQGVVGSPSMEVLKSHGDVALRDTVGWCGMGLGDPTALFQPL